MRIGIGQIFFYAFGESVSCAQPLPCGMKLQHAIYIYDILEMPIWLSFDYGIVHIYTRQEGGANTAHVLQQHRPLYCLTCRWPARYTCRSVDGTRRSSSAW